MGMGRGTGMWAALLVACVGPYTSERFAEDFPEATCRQEARCNEESWYLTEGMEACEASVRERFGWEAVGSDPCLAFDEVSARECLDAIDGSCDDRVLSFQLPESCNTVYDWTCNDEGVPEDRPE